MSLKILLMLNPDQALHSAVSNLLNEFCSWIFVYTMYTPVHEISTLLYVSLCRENLLREGYCVGKMEELAIFTGYGM